MAGTTVFGFQCKIYVDASTDPEVPDFKELTEAVDAVLGLQFVEADATCRESGGLEVAEPSLLQAEVTGKLQWRNGPDNASTALNVLRLRASSRSLVVARILTGANDDPNSRGMKGHWKITKWAYSQELKELVSVEFAMKPAFSTFQLVTADQGFEEVAAADTENKAAETEKATTKV